MTNMTREHTAASHVRNALLCVYAVPRITW